MDKYFWIRESWLLDCTIVSEPDIDEEIDFLIGEQINAGFEVPLVFGTSYKKGSQPHHYFDYATSIPVVSDRFVEALQKAGIHNFQLFPAILENAETATKWSDYHAMNVLGMIPATDLAHSQYESIMPDNNDGQQSLGVFTVLALKKVMIQGEDMFREPYGGCLVMSETALRKVLSYVPEGGFGILCHEVVLV